MDERARINLMDVSFLIPVRIDSMIRLENLLASINHILKYFNTNIFVMEAASLNNHVLEDTLPESVSYTYVEDYDPVFHRTRYINMLARKSFSPFIAIWDADIIIDYGQILRAVELLRDNDCEVVFPYNGVFYDTTSIIREVYLKNGEFSVLSTNTGKMLLPYGTNMGGGALFLKRISFEFAGGEDEGFYGWGPEDWNRIEKWKKMNFRLMRTDGPLFHLSHPRDMNGRMNSVWQKRQAFNRLRNTKLGNKEEIEKTFKNVRNDYSSIPMKLHIGCGSCIIPGWLNTDIRPSDEKVMYMDATKPLPFEDGYFKFVFSEHMIEHVSLENGISMLHEIYRVLQSGGIIRIVTPAFELLEKLCSEPSSDSNGEYINWSVKSFSPACVVPLGLDTHDMAVVTVNTFMHSWGHKMIYSHNILESVLRHAGFIDITRCEVGQSRHKDLEDIEHHGEQIPQWANVMETMVYEARKPTERSRQK